MHKNAVCGFAYLITFSLVLTVMFIDTDLKFFILFCYDSCWHTFIFGVKFKVFYNVGKYENVIVIICICRRSKSDFVMCYYRPIVTQIYLVLLDFMTSSVPSFDKCKCQYGFCLPCHHALRVHALCAINELLLQQQFCIFHIVGLQCGLRLWFIV